MFDNGARLALGGHRGPREEGGIVLVGLGVVEHRYDTGEGSAWNLPEASTKENEADQSNKATCLRGLAKRIRTLGGSWGVVVLQTRDVTTDDAGFADFFARRYERLVRACILLTGGAAEGEDLAQEAMARVLERWDRVSGMDDPGGYLYRTALNVHRKALRRLAVAARRRAFSEPSDDPDVTDRHLDLRRAIRSLPRAQREALVLVEWFGYSAEEAAVLLGIEATSVRGRLHRARQSLRQRYGGSDE
jgi:RNA polymerase sigma factor (sigma-70 family)